MERNELTAHREPNFCTLLPALNANINNHALQDHNNLAPYTTFKDYTTFKEMNDLAYNTSADIF